MRTALGAMFGVPVFSLVTTGTYDAEAVIIPLIAFLIGLIKVWSMARRSPYADGVTHNPDAVPIVDLAAAHAR